MRILAVFALVLLTPIAGADPVAVGVDDTSAEAVAVSATGEARACQDGGGLFCVAVSGAGDAVACESEVPVAGSELCLAVAPAGDAAACERGGTFQHHCVATAGQDASSCSEDPFTQECYSLAIFGNATSCTEILFTECRAYSVLGHSRAETVCVPGYACVAVGDDAACEWVCVAVSSTQECTGDVCVVRDPSEPSVCLDECPYSASREQIY